jgi:hypothetical protein
VASASRIMLSSSSSSLPLVDLELSRPHQVCDISLRGANHCIRPWRDTGFWNILESWAHNMDLYSHRFWGARSYQCFWKLYEYRRWFIWRNQQWLRKLWRYVNTVLVLETSGDRSSGVWLHTMATNMLLHSGPASPYFLGRAVLEIDEGDVPLSFVQILNQETHF